MFVILSNFGEPLNTDHKKYVSLNNQPCQTKLAMTNINSNEPFYYSFTTSANKCGGSCNTIDDPYAWVCVPNKLQNMNEVFDAMPGGNETRFLVQHESCECRCRLNENLCD